ncbi:MAG: SRPBCC family protein [Acidimicrobiia bacterium]|nr:SRPBCC family protein [Acidimicrobiia bacterium]
MADTYTVQRSVSIDAPAASIYPHLIDFHRWTAWSPWEDLDPNLQRTYSGPDAGPGAIYTWSGNRKAGEGRMEVTEAAEPAKVVVAVDFLKPFKSSSITTIEMNENGEATEVTWTMSGPKTLMTRVMGIFTSMDKMIGPDFEKGLTRLKAVAEAGA